MADKEEDLRPYLSRKLVHQMHRGFKFGSIWSSHPYAYSKENQRFEMVKGLRLWFWYFNVAFTVLHFLFVLVRLVQVKMDSSATLETRVGMEFMAVYYFYPVTFQMAFIAFGDDLCISGNLGIAFFRKFSPYARRTYWTKSGKLLETWVGEILLDTVNYWVFAIMVVFVVAGILQPGIPVFISSLLQNPWDPASIPLRALSLTVTLHEHLLYVGNIYLLINTGVAITFGMLPAMTHIRLAGNRKNGWERDLNWYTQFGLVIIYLNSCYGDIVLPFTQVILIMLSVYGVFAAARMSGFFRLSIVTVGVICYIFLIALFRSLAEYDKRSSNLLLKWSQLHGRNGIMTRVLRSLKPIRIKLRDNYIDIYIVLTITDIVISNSITILLL